jgi:hypothetical protein
VQQDEGFGLFRSRHGKGSGREDHVLKELMESIIHFLFLLSLRSFSEPIHTSYEGTTEVLLRGLAGLMSGIRLVTIIPDEACLHFGRRPPVILPGWYTSGREFDLV